MCVGILPPTAARFGRGVLPDLGAAAKRRRTALATTAATSLGSRCSHARNTNHPACLSVRFVSKSRRRLASIFSRQNWAFAFGQVACRGQPCQKHPSTNTATRARRNTMSARRGQLGNGFASTEYRRPSAWRSLLTASSAGVSRRSVACIRFRTKPEDAAGRSTLVATRALAEFRPGFEVTTGLGRSSSGRLDLLVTTPGALDGSPGGPPGGP